jgi:dTDP-4-dehydrorhamnose reductase
MTRILIFGGTGMLGHKLAQRLSSVGDTAVTVRQRLDIPAKFFENVRMVTGVSVEDMASVRMCFDQINPDFAINCVGIVKQKKEAKAAIPSIEVNSLWPHQLADLSAEHHCKMITFSTDCVFSGRRGNYSEQDIPDPVDLYGRSKLLGEVDSEATLTIRTSMIGRELAGSHGLLEWFLGHQGERVKGFKRAIFSGLTTNALSDLIADLITRRPNLSGLYQVASDPINKFDLLSLINRIYGLDIDIEPEEEFSCDRSLNGERFEKVTGIKIPIWTDMITQMHKDITPYSELKRTHVN